MQDLMEESGAYVFLTHELNAAVYRDDIVPGLLPDGTARFAGVQAGEIVDRGCVSGCRGRPVATPSVQALSTGRTQGRSGQREVAADGLAGWAELRQRALDRGSALARRGSGCGTRSPRVG